MEWRSADGVEWLEARLPGARAAFSTRTGGVSEPPYASLNLGILTGDERDAVVENRSRLAAALGLAPERVVIGRQVHGADLETHCGPQVPSPFASPRPAVPEVDGHLTAEPGLAALVFVADCLPVALAGPGRIAMLHCGWRGLAAGIVYRGAEAVGATDAAIGPGIGPCCYEVGPEVLDAFAGLGIPATGPTLDLTEAARRLLRDAGVERIEAAGLCTSCDEDRFFSHRRDAGDTGRQAGLAWLERGASRHPYLVPCAASEARPIAEVG
jgi:polyphenol oxidase